jgi:hypothetical protein
MESSKSVKSQSRLEEQGDDKRNFRSMIDHLFGAPTNPELWFR